MKPNYSSMKERNGLKNSETDVNIAMIQCTNKEYRRMLKAKDKVH
jgi:hypothetical protein